MSIASEITRLADLRDTIRSKILDFGIITDSAAKLSACSEAIDGISIVTPSTPATSISVMPTISAPTTAGVVTVSGSATASVKPTTAKGYTKGAGTAGTITAKTSGTKTITTQAAKTWTPTTSNQTIAAGRWLTGAQTIKGDSNLVAANILKGKSIFGVSGTGNGLVYKTATVQDANSAYKKWTLVYSHTDDDPRGDDDDTTEFYHIFVPVDITGMNPRFITTMETNSTYTSNSYAHSVSNIFCNGTTVKAGYLYSYESLKWWPPNSVYENKVITKSGNTILVWIQNDCVFDTKSYFKIIIVGTPA